MDLLQSTKLCIYVSQTHKTIRIAFNNDKLRETILSQNISMTVKFSEFIKGTNYNWEILVYDIRDNFPGVRLYDIGIYYIKKEFQYLLGQFFLPFFLIRKNFKFYKYRMQNNMPVAYISTIKYTQLVFFQLLSSILELF